MRREILRALEGRGAVVRIRILFAEGSTPREAGTAMLVWQDGTSGTIGGGALEWEAMRSARAMLGEEVPWLRRVLDMPLGPTLGQCCGGRVRLLLERYARAEAEALPEGAFHRPMQSGPPVEAPGEGIVSDWPEEMLPVWVWGAGHVGRALVSVLAGLPFKVTWIDISRERFAQTGNSADIVVAAEPVLLVPHAPDDAQHFVMTHAHDLDFALVSALLARPCRRVGLIGSATKRARFESRLRQLGQGDFARLECPIGDPSLGKEPQAIAIGIAADLLRSRA